MAVVAPLLAVMPLRAETTKAGQPICTTSEHAVEYLATILTKDRAAMARVEGCSILKAGLRMTIEEKGAPVSGIRIDKVRVFGTGGSAVAFTIDVDD